MLFQRMTNKHTAYVRASGEDEARQLLVDEYESDDWLDPVKASCERIWSKGDPVIVGYFDHDEQGL